MNTITINQLFLRTTHVKCFTNYSSNSIIFDMTLGNLVCAKGYTKALLRLDKSLEITDTIILKISSCFNNAIRAVLVDKGTKHSNNYLEIYYID